jgi:hypothetical protein
MECNTQSEKVQHPNMDMEFWNEHIITHKVIRHYDDKQVFVGVGPYNMCKRYVEGNPKAKFTIEEL